MKVSRLEEHNIVRNEPWFHQKTISITWYELAPRYENNHFPDTNKLSQFRSKTNLFRITDEYGAGTLRDQDVSGETSQSQPVFWSCLCKKYPYQYLTAQILHIQISMTAFKTTWLASIAPVLLYLKQFEHWLNEEFKSGS